jgi:hypothetical protein
MQYHRQGLTDPTHLSSLSPIHQPRQRLTRILARAHTTLNSRQHIGPDNQYLLKYQAMSCFIDSDIPYQIFDLQTCCITDTIRLLLCQFLLLPAFDEKLAFIYPSEDLYMLVIFSADAEM